MEIRHASMYDLPLAVAVLQLVNFTLPQSFAFDRAAADFLIAGEKALVEQVHFHAPTVEIYGAGVMNYRTRELSLDMFTRDPAGVKNFGPFDEVVRVFRDELVNIHVTGTLEDPKTEVRSFQGIQRSIEEVFGKPAERPAAPQDDARAGTPNTSGQ